MRIVVSWFSNSCIFQATYSQEDLPAAKKLFYDQLSKWFDQETVDIFWENVQFEFDASKDDEYRWKKPDNFTDRIHSTFIVTYLI